MPTTTTGIATEFITFSRPGATQGGATVTDSDGLVKWAPHNLLLNSESFDTTSWTKTTTTVDANSIAAPNGTTTADTLTAAGANSTTLQSYTALAVPYTFGVWLRRKTGTGDIQIAADSGTYTTVTITSSWALYTVSQTPAAGTISAGIRIVTSADEVYVWGAALYRSDLGGMQPNASAYTLYNPTTPKNLLGYTEDFANAGWQKLNIAAFGSGSISNAIAAPNGLQTADKVVANTTSGEHFIYQSCTGGGKNTFSIYLKASEYYLARIIEISAYRFYATVNLLTGAITNSGGASLTFAGATDVGNGWWRCEIEHSSSAACAYSVMGFPNTITPTNAPANYTGDGISGIYLWGAQVSDSASLDTYSPVYGAAVTSAAYYGPRRDFNASTLACNGLLVEEQRTNLALQSAAFDETTWTKNQGGVGIIPTVTPNVGIAPDGALNADRIQFSLNGGTSVSDVSDIRQLITTTAVAHTLSFWARSYDGTSTYSMLARDANGFVNLLTVTGSWSRFTVTATYGAVTSTIGFGIRGGQAVVNSNTADILVWGAQLEAGSFATSYIPTGSTSATRTADTASVSAQAFPYNSTEGTLVAYFQPVYELSTYRTQIMLTNDAVTNLVVLRAFQTSTNIAVNSQVTEGTLQVDYNSSGVASPYLIKTGIALKANDFANSTNGSAATPDTSGSMPTGITKLGFNGGTYYIGATYIRQITYLPRRVTNAELQTRTS